MKSKYRILEQQADNLLGLNKKGKKKKVVKLKKQKPYFVSEVKDMYKDYLRKIKE